MAISRMQETTPPTTQGIPRRKWLKAAGAALLASPLLPAVAKAQPPRELRALARQNLKLAIFGPTYSSLSLAKAVDAIGKEGFSGVLTDFRFADVKFDPLRPDWEAAKKITDTMAKGGLSIVSLHGYYNVIDPDPARRRRGRARVECLMRNWARFGCRIIATETGTRNAASEWESSPDNATEEAYLECRQELAQLAQLAEKTGAILAVEPYWKHVIDSAAKAERLFCEIDSPALRLVMDPCNYLRKEELPCQKAVLCDLFQRLGDQIVIAHAKDVRASSNGTELPAAGCGALDYPHYLKLLADLDHPFSLVLEHVEMHDVARARNFVIDQYAKL